MTQMATMRNKISLNTSKIPYRTILNIENYQTKNLINLAKKQQPVSKYTKLPMKSPRNPVQLMKHNKNIKRFADLWSKI